MDTLHLETRSVGNKFDEIFLHQKDGIFGMIQKKCMVIPMVSNMKKLSSRGSSLDYLRNICFSIIMNGKVVVVMDANYLIYC